MATPIRPFKRIKKRHAWDIPAAQRICAGVPPFLSWQHHNAWNDPLGIMHMPPSSMTRPAAAIAAQQVLQTMSQRPPLVPPPLPMQRPRVMFPPSLVASASIPTQEVEIVEDTSENTTSTKHTASSTQKQGLSNHLGASNGASTNSNLGIYLTPEGNLANDIDYIGNNRLRILLSLIKKDLDDYEQSRVAIELVNMVQVHWKGHFYMGQDLIDDEDQVYECVLGLVEKEEFKTTDVVSNLIQEYLEKDGEKKMPAVTADKEKVDQRSSSHTASKKKRAHDTFEGKEATATTVTSPSAINLNNKQVRFNIAARVSMEQSELMESSRLVAAASLQPQQLQDCCTRKSFPPRKTSPRVSLGQEDLLESTRSVAAATAAASLQDQDGDCHVVEMPSRKMAPPEKKAPAAKSVLQIPGLDPAEVVKLREAAVHSLKAKQERDYTMAKRDVWASYAPIMAKNIFSDPSEIRKVQEAAASSLQAKQGQLVSENNVMAAAGGVHAAASVAPPPQRQQQELSALAALCSLVDGDSESKDKAAAAAAASASNEMPRHELQGDAELVRAKRNAAIAAEVSGASSRKAKKKKRSSHQPLTYGLELDRARLTAAAAVTTSRKKKRPITPPDRDEEQEYHNYADAAEASSIEEEPYQAHRLKSDEAWNHMFERLLQYKEEYGDCLVPYSWEHDRKLGDWVRVQISSSGAVDYPPSHSVDCRLPFSQVSAQRKRYKKGILQKDRVQRLEEIGFVWALRRQEPWQLMFDRLKEFKQQHGHLVIPQSYQPNPKLARWVVDQRNHMRKGRLSEDRYRKLRELGFETKAWQQKTVSQEQPRQDTLLATDEDDDGEEIRVYDSSSFWNSMFEKLKRYKMEKGDCWVPERYTENPALGAWVSRLQKESLSCEQLQKLESIGFVFSCIQQLPWDNMVETAS